MDGSIIQHQEEKTSWVVLHEEMLQESDEGQTISTLGSCPSQGIVFPAVSTKDMVSFLNAWRGNLLLLTSFHPAGSQGRVQA